MILYIAGAVIGLVVLVLFAIGVAAVTQIRDDVREMCDRQWDQGPSRHGRSSLGKELRKKQGEF